MAACDRRVVRLWRCFSSLLYPIERGAGEFIAPVARDLWRR